MDKASPLYSYGLGGYKEKEKGRIPLHSSGRPDPAGLRGLSPSSSIQVKAVGPILRTTWPFL